MADSYLRDSFFFRSEEPDGSNYSRMNPREATKSLARNREDIFADELSRLTDDEYIEDIMRHIKRMEACSDDPDKTLPDVTLIDMQSEIEWSMRPYLIDFLFKAHAAFALQPETLFLTINLLDRYCSKRVVYKKHYQLLGCATLLIAAKYGDKKMRVPQMHELKYICCGLYEADAFAQMEIHVLNTLEWSIGHPTVYFFSQLIIAERGDDQEVQNMAAYICEVALYHRDFVSTKPSTIARSSLALARAILGRAEVNDGEWDDTNNLTMSILCHHLHQPSPTLGLQYKS
ncbi:cyclin-like protein [Ilyonectria destructans]|nr:cyclin-like protein [Ilyonectria destructans]